MPRIDWVDLSKWQGVIPAVVYRLWRSSGVQGVIFKVGGGNAGRYRDSAFAANLANAQAAGLQTQGYWFNGETDPVADAEFAHSVTPPGFFIWADIENEGSMPHWNPPQANAFQTRLEQLGHPTGAYMSQSVTFGDWSLINHRPLWVAAYGPSSVPRVGSWRAPVLWQHSSSGQLPGYGGRLDVNEAQTGFTSIFSSPISRTDDDEMLSPEAQDWLNKALDARVAKVINTVQRENRGRLFFCPTPPAGLPRFVIIFEDRNPGEHNIMYVSALDGLTDVQRARNLNATYGQTADTVEQAMAAPDQTDQYLTRINLALGTDPVYTAS